MKNLVRALIPDNPLVGIETKETIGPVYGMTLEGFSWSTSDLADNKNEVVAYTKDFEFLKNIQGSVPNVLARMAARTDRTRYTVQKW